MSPKSSVISEGITVHGIRLSCGKVVFGRTFIEATYEGDLLAAAGISSTQGRESRSTYGESLAGVRENTTYTQITTSMDPYNVTGDASSGLLYGISDEPFGNPGDGDEHLAAFSFRLPLTDDEDNRLPIYKPEGYDPAHYELHRRYVKSGGNLFTPKIRLPGRKTDLIGSEAPLATDLVGMNDAWATGSQEDRQRILDETTRFTKGLLYFFTSDESLPVSVVIIPRGWELLTKAL